MCSTMKLQTDFAYFLLAYGIALAIGKYTNVNQRLSQYTNTQKTIAIFLLVIFSLSIDFKDESVAVKIPVDTLSWLLVNSIINDL
jgi:hypothetical protein